MLFVFFAVAIGLVWDSDRPEKEHIVDVIKCLGTSLRMPDVSQHLYLQPFLILHFDDKKIRLINQKRTSYREMNLYIKCSFLTPSLRRPCIHAILRVLPEAVSTCHSWL